MSDFVSVYDTRTGAKLPKPVPRSWVGHPVLGEYLSTTPKAAAAQAAAVPPATPGSPASVPIQTPADDVADATAGTTTNTTSKGK